MSDFRIATAKIRKIMLVIDGDDRILVFPVGVIDDLLLERANVLLSLAEAG